MKRIFPQIRPSNHSARLLAHLFVLLLSLGLYSPASQSAEPGSLTSNTGWPDYMFNADYPSLLPWSCCTEFDSLYSDEVRQLCDDEHESCLEVSTDGDMRDSAGLKRDTWYFLGYQWVTIGILYAMPESVSGWSDEQKDGYSMSIWWDNVTHPQIDSDDFYINYILHPYWGAAYFVRARERGYSNKGSFWYSVLLSSAYEFGAEALFEEASIQDLIVTPIGGSLLGMYFMKVRDRIREREMALGHKTTGDKWLWVLTDPLGSLNHQFDKLFGWDTELQLRPYSYVRRHDPATPLESIPWKEDRVYGLEVSLRW